MNYIHCYNCYLQPKPANEHLFHISSCGKLFCSQKCLKNVNLNKCDTCSKCEVILLTNAPPQVQEFFADVGNVLEDMKRKCNKIMDYQNGLRDRMFKCVYKKYTDLKSHYIKLQQEHTTLIKDYKRLQEHIKREENSFGVQPTTAIPGRSNNTFGTFATPSLPRSTNSSKLYGLPSSSRNPDPRMQHRTNPNRSLNETSTIVSTPLNSSDYGSTLRNSSNASGSFLALTKLALDKYKRK